MWSCFYCFIYVLSHLCLSWLWTTSVCTGSSAGAASEKCTVAGRLTQERCKEERTKAAKAAVMLRPSVRNLCCMNVRYAMKCLDKKRIKMKQGETLALNERIMLSLVSTGVSCTQQQLLWSAIAVVQLSQIANDERKWLPNKNWNKIIFK